MNRETNTRETGKAHPMAILSSMVVSLSTYYPDAAENDLDLNIVRLLAKVNTITVYAYKNSIGQHMPAFNCVPTTRLPSGSKRN